MGAISTMFGAAAQIFTAQPAADAANAASTTQYNRERLQADTAITQAQQQGAYASGKTRIAGDQLAAQQRTAYADSGVVSSSGTAANVQGNTMALSELDAQQQSINAAKQVYGFKVARDQSREDFFNRQATTDNTEQAAVLGGVSKFASAGIQSAAMG